jgi:6-phosphogluconolactonase (cycloisomerase 2 family)
LTLLQVCSANGIEPEKGLDASGIAITPDGKFVFAAVRGFGRPVDLIVHYQVLSDGQLKPIGQTPTGSIPWVISLDTTGKYLLVSAAKGGTLTAYRITSTGSLEKGASIVWGQQYRDMTVR